MKKLIFVIILFLTVHLVAQEQKLDYLDEPLSIVITDLETKFSVRFAFNSAILKDKTIRFSGNITLEGVLIVIKHQAALDFQFIDPKNIIIKRAAIDPSVATTDLDEVFISKEYLTTGFDKIENDGSIKVSPDELGILPGLTEPDVLQSLQLLPGISSPTESASDIHIRGGTPDQNLVLWDGIKMYHQGHFFGQISAFNPYITETINVFRSGTSAKYGDRISGVIDIRSSDQVHDSLHIGIGANLIQADAFIKAPIVKNKLSLTASVRRSYSDILNTFTFQKMNTKVFQNTKVGDGQTSTYAYSRFVELENKFYFTDYNFKSVWKPNNKHTISFSSLFVVNKLDYNSINFISEETSVNSVDNLDLTNNGFNFKWDVSLSNKTSIKTSAYSSSYKSKYGYQDTYGQDLYTTNNLNNIKDLGTTIGLHYTSNKNNTFRFGYDLVSNSIDYIISSDYADNDGNNNPFEEKDSDKLNIHTVFSEYLFDKHKWTIQAGLRASQISTINKDLFEPRLYLNYKLNRHWGVKSSFEVKNQSISKVLSSTQNDLGLGNSLWVLADKDRPIINNRQFSIGTLYEHKGWKLDIDGYYKKIKGITILNDLFSTTPSGNENEKTFSSGKSESFGIDVLIKKRIKNYRVWLSYSLSKTNYFFEDINEVNNEDPNKNNWYLGNFDQTHILSLSNTFTYKKFQLSLGWNIATGKPYTNAIAIDNQGGNITYEPLNKSRLNTYHKLDASIVYDFYLSNRKSVKARIGASVINIYDRENELEKTFRADDIEAIDSPIYDYIIVEQTSYGLGFTPNFVFRLNF